MDEGKAIRLNEQLEGIRYELRTANLFAYRQMVREMVLDLDHAPGRRDPAVDAAYVTELADLADTITDRLDRSVSQDD